jgi:CheY-like chemotaxis protein
VGNRVRGNQFAKTGSIRTQELHLKTKELLEHFKGRLTRDQLYSWERNHLVRPTKLNRGIKMQGRDYSDTEVQKIAKMIELRDAGLPIRVAHRQAQELIADSAPADPKSVLIVEDDPVHRFILEDEFRADFHVEFAADESRALNYFHSGKIQGFDVMILDLRIPATSTALESSTDHGINVLRAWENLEGHKPTVYVMSGYLVNGARERVVKFGVDQNSILDKPFSPLELRQEIEKKLADKN